MENQNHIVTFDEQSVQSMKEFMSKINDSQLHKTIQDSEKLIKFNLEKVFKCISKTPSSEYNGEKFQYLMAITHCITTAINKYLYALNNLTEYIIKLDLHQVFKVILEHFNKSENNFENLALKYLIGALGNLTSIKSITLQNAKSGIIEIILQILTNPKLTNSGKFDSIVLMDLHDGIIKFLYNNSKESEVREELNAINVTKYLINHKKDLDAAINNKNNENIQIIKAYLTSILAFLFDDNQLDTLEISNEIVSTLLNMLQKTINQSSENPIRQNTKFYLTYKIGDILKFTYAGNILNCLLRISVNDRIKQIMFELHGLDAIIKILKDDSDLYDQRLCSQLLLTLSFNQNIKNQIKNDSKILELIESKTMQFKNQEDVMCLKKVIQVANRVLDNRKSSKHIMISYCHENKANCLKLNQILKSKGYNTWIDVEHTLKNLLDDLAEAVDNSSIVLICYSEAYKMSANCRLEAEYSLDCKKPIIPVRMQAKYKPDGWLRFLIGMKFYFDISDPNLNETHSTLIKLLDYINMSLSDKFEYRLNDTPANATRIDEKREQIKKWSNNEIKYWLNTNNLNEFLSLFNGYCGLSLLALYDLKKSNNTYFCENIDNEIKKLNLNLSFSSKLKLFQIIDDLL